MLGRIPFGQETHRLVAAREPVSQRGGLGFESPRLHQQERGSVLDPSKQPGLESRDHWNALLADLLTLAS